MLVIEINTINVEPLQAGLTGSPYIGWIAANLHLLSVRGDDPKFGSQLNFLSHPPLNGVTLPRRISLM
ncbi:hypothetical protein RHGRI_003992 [Rhododendron griersonianum]|uniref:Uncharacterized protein n=1 Tax=Rhododendron griersonianum TaxID=479676 RepID=A0AAV6L6X2_9ERIC|nr:hypothetical protein RHGRI_003992 [Rhododendron griersonianum]